MAARGIRNNTDDLCELRPTLFKGYLVSPTGDVWSEKRNPLLKQWEDQDGYYHVVLFNKGIRYFPLVHRLVAYAFCPNPNNYTIVCHNDGNCKNNNYKNLRWDTQKNNIKDKNVHGTQLRGEQVYNHKLTEQQVKEIKALYIVDGNSLLYSAEEVASKFGVTRQCVHRIWKGYSWSHVE